VACPFFMPMEKLADGAWLHASRLPLGGGWSGRCTAPGYEAVTPSQDELQEFCNLGYAEGCSRLPRERAWDSVRFSARAVVDEDTDDIARILLRYVCERAHCPVEHGVLEFDFVRARWNKLHGDERVQRMAECFLQSYVEKRKSPGMEQAAS